MNLGNSDIYGVLKGFYPALLVLIMKVQVLTTGSVDRLVKVDKVYVQSLGKISDVTVLVTVTLCTVQGPK